MHDDSELPTLKEVAAAFVTSAALGAAGFLFSRYRVCKPSQYMVKTGLGIKDMTVCKRGIQFPFQKVEFIDMHPRNYRFTLNHLSKEKVPFNLPVTFNIAPIDPNNNLPLFKNWSRKMSNLPEADISNIILSAIHGETRILCSGMTIEEMFSDKTKFKAMVSDSIQKDLDQYGAQICNANIEEMLDMPGHHYFSYRERNAMESANNETLVQVAEAKKKGDIGQSEMKAASLQRIAQIDADTAKIENERLRDVEESRKNLAVSKAEFRREKELAETEAAMAVTMRSIELKQATEARRVQQELETLRATDLSKAKVDAESTVQRAEGEVTARKLLADATLYTEMKKAEGLEATFQAQAAGINKLLASTGNNPHLLQFYLAHNSGLYTELAKASAEGVRGLAPKINVWNTGDSKNDTFGFLKGLMNSLPPMLDVLKTQTDIPLPTKEADKQPDKSLTVNELIAYLDKDPKDKAPARLVRDLAREVSSKP